MKYILALDQGTTGTTAALIDAKNLNFIDKINKEYKQVYPRPGEVEHNLQDIWATVEHTISEVIKNNNVDFSDISCIGVTNQRETTCAFSKTGQPLANAIVWQDRRTSAFCQDLKSKGIEQQVKSKTGLPLDPYFSATKMRWLLQNNDNVKKASENGNLLFGTIDTFLIYKLTGNLSFKTEASNASRTLLMDLETCQWDGELLDLFSVKREYLPEICNSFWEFGKTKGLGFLPDGIPITGVLGDQQAALFGQAGISPGDIKCTYGTGAFILSNTGDKLISSQSGLLTTVAFKHDNHPCYALEGSCYIAGAAVQWLRDNLGLISKSPDVESLARSVEKLDEMEHVMFFPFFTGIGSPYWNSDAKAAIVGLTRDTSKGHIARACLDGISLSINDLITAMRNDTGQQMKSLRVDGGAVSNNLLMEIQATISNLTIIRPKVIETTAYGAALAAALGNNIIKMTDIMKFWEEDRQFHPVEKEVNFYSSKKETWKKTIHKLFL